MFKKGYVNMKKTITKHLSSIINPIILILIVVTGVYINILTTMYPEFTFMAVLIYFFIFVEFTQIWDKLEYRRFISNLVTLIERINSSSISYLELSALFKSRIRYFSISESISSKDDLVSIVLFLVPQKSAVCMVALKLKSYAS